MAIRNAAFVMSRVVGLNVIFDSLARLCGGPFNVVLDVELSRTDSSVTGRILSQNSPQLAKTSVVGRAAG